MQRKRGRLWWAASGAAFGAALAAGCGDDESAASSDAASTRDAVVTDASVLDAAIPDAALADAPQADAASVCGIEDSYVNPDGDHYQYVFDALLLPTTATQANLYGLNIDGDAQGRPDNGLGQVLSTLAYSSEIDFQAASDRALSSGDIITLTDVQATALTTATEVGVWVAQGGNPTIAPCLDENDQVCGRHLSGTSSFDVLAQPEPEVVAGSLHAGEFAGGPGIVSVRIALFEEGEPITLVLYGARLEIDNVTELGMVHGRLGGGIVKEELESTVFPAMHEGMIDTISAHCTGEPIDCPGAGCRPCGCEEGSSGRQLLDLFDEDIPGDCTIGYQEFRDNSLISPLLYPDVDLFDCAGGDWPVGCCFEPRTDWTKDALSVGFAFSAVGATFSLPAAMGGDD